MVSKSTDKKWHESALFIAVISSILPVVFTLIVDYFKKVPILSTIKTIINVIYEYALFLLAIELKVWWVLILFIVTFLFNKYINRVKGVEAPNKIHNTEITNKESQSYPNEPLRKSYTEDVVKKLKWDSLRKSYTEDVLKKWKWTWQWQISPLSHTWHPIDLTPYCPICDTRLVFYQTVLKKPFYYKCPRCEYESDSKSTERTEMIKALIIDNIIKKFKNEPD